LPAVMSNVDTTTCSFWSTPNPVILTACKESHIEYPHCCPELLRTQSMMLTAACNAERPTIIFVQPRCPKSSISNRVMLRSSDVIKLRTVMDHRCIVSCKLSSYTSDQSYSRKWLLVAIMRIELLPVDRNTYCTPDSAMSSDHRPTKSDFDEEMTMIGVGE
jgi:hypothetical protein